MLLIALSMMPLAGVTAIMFSSPIFSTLASAYFLHEKVGPTRWTVLLVGFLGVLIIASPGVDTFQIGALFALGNAVLFGTVVAGVRGMAATESTETLIMYQLTLLTVCYALFLPFGFTMPTAFDALIMIGSGIGNGVAQYLWTRAIHLAPTSAVVPFQYLAARLGDAARLRDLGRDADRRAADRLRDRDRLGTVSVLARDAARAGGRAR